MTTTSSDNSKSALKHFFAGAAPAAAAALLLLIHALQPIVDHDHQGYLFIISGGLIAVSLAIWCWCVTQGVAAPFASRNEAADTRQLLLLQQTADNHAVAMKTIQHLDRAVQAGHKRLDAIEKRLAAIEKRYAANGEEITHLRKLILHQDDLEAFGQERLGPRALH